MAGVVHPQRSRLAVGVGDLQHRRFMIDRPAFRAAIGGKGDFALRPGQPAGFAFRAGLLGHGIEFAEKLLGVAVNILLMLGRNRLAKKRRRDVRQHRGAVRVRRADCEALAGNSQLLRDFRAHRFRHAEIVNGDQHAQIGIAANRQRLGEDVLLDAIRFGAPAAVAAEAYGVTWRDVDRGHADWRQRLLREGGYGRGGNDDRGGKKTWKGHGAPSFGRVHLAVGRSCPT